MKKGRLSLTWGAPTLFCLAMFGCKVSDDAIAASAQMTATASSLNSYYTALGNSVTETIALYELDGAISGIPFDAESRKIPVATREEIEQRKQIAIDLGKLAASMSTLSHSKASADVETSATALGNELIKVKALPGGSPVPDAVGKAGNFLIQVIQQHEEKSAARAMDQTLAAVGDLFEKEKTTYDSITRTHLREASQVAQSLTNADGVDPTPMLNPAVKPFGLAAMPANQQLRGTLKQLALSRLAAETDRAVNREMVASDAMLGALREMSSRVHLLATEKPMPIRGNPFSLKVVESWTASVL